MRTVVGQGLSADKQYIMVALCMVQHQKTLKEH